jgi:L-fuconolactonase
VISRRQFLGAAVTTLLVPSRATPAVAPPEGGTVDTHTHFYDPERPQGVPWPPSGDKVLFRRVLPPEYIALAKPHGITGTVVVEASPWLEDNQWLLDLADREPFLLAIVGNLNPLDADFAKHLARFAAHPRFRGIRVSGQQLIERGREPAYIDALKRLSDANRSLDLNGSRAYLEHVPALARAIPELRIVLDHVASAGDPAQLSPTWRDHLRASGQSPNVYCKVSGIPEQAGAPVGEAPTDWAFYRPILDAVWEAFGEDRLIFGSNWPVCDRATKFEHVIRITNEYVQSKGRGAVEKVFRRNAQNFYRWPS